MTTPNGDLSNLTRNPSLWMATSPWPEYPALDGNRDVDAAVIGSGITGLTAARLLADEGMTVAVVESRRICSGVTGLTTAKITALQSTIYSDLLADWGEETIAAYAEANLAGLKWIRHRVEEDSIDCDLATAPAFTYAESAEGVAAIEREAEAARRAGLDVELTTETDLPFEVAAAVRLADQARFHPRSYCLGLVQGIVAGGGLIFEHTRATDIDGRQGIVVTDKGNIRADVIVVATHVPFVETGLYSSRMTASRSYAVAFRSGGPTVDGMYISVDDPLRSIRAAGDGYTVVGGEAHPSGDGTSTEDRYRALEEWSRERFGATAIDYRWSSQDYRSPDGLPYVGPLGSSGRVFMATGFRKWGMAMGTTSATIMVDQALGRDARWAEVFDSKRLSIKQEASNVVKAGVRAVASVTKRVLPPKLPDASELAAGTGGVVSFQGKTAAVFRDDDGSIRAVSPVCTHLGCQVAFNDAERSWDCPCHGSRFDLDGAVIHGPATRDLTPIEIDSAKVG